jgi:hypothetical protein
MLARNVHSRRYAVRLFAWIYLATVMLFLFAGCAASAPQSSTAQKTPTTASSSPTASSTQSAVGPVFSPVAPTGTPSVLHGPSNFVLHTPFKFQEADGTTTNADDTPTPIETSVIENEMTQQFQHTLFVVDANDNVDVYNPGSDTPIKATVTQRIDGSVELDYSQSDNQDTGSTQLGFTSSLFDNQIYVQYQQQYSPTITGNGVDSQVEIAFSTTIEWVLSSQIPTAPLHARFQFTPSQTIILAWDPAQHASGYDIYRMIPSEDPEFEFLATVTGTTYTDTSSDAWSNAHTSSGVEYGVFAVGPTGVENPSGLAIPIETS